MVTDDGNHKQAPSLGKVLFSVIAGFFGVQSNKRRNEDFTHGKPIHYILIGLLFTVIFVLTIWGVVHLVIP